MGTKVGNKVLKNPKPFLHPISLCFHKSGLKLGFQVFREPLLLFTIKFQFFYLFFICIDVSRTFTTSLTTDSDGETSVFHVLL